MTRVAAIARGLAFPLAVIALLQIGALAVHLQSDTLAAPAAAFVAGVRAFADGSIPFATLQTLANAFGGLALGGAFGLLGGLVLGSVRTADRLMEFSVEALRPIPAVALIPVAMLIFGFGYRMEIGIVAFASFWPVLILTRNAVAGVDRALYDVARVLQLDMYAARYEDRAARRAAAHFRRIPARRGHRTHRCGDSRSVDESARPRLWHHGRRAIAASRFDARLSRVDRDRGLGIESCDHHGAEPVLRPLRARRHGAMTRAGWRIASVVVGGAFVLVWQVLSNAHVISPVYFPGPDRTWTALTTGFANGTLPAQLWQTVQRMLVGWLLASLIGVVLGALIGMSKPARTYLGPTLEFLRPLPASAVIPLGIAFFGLSDGMVLGVIAFGALWPTLLATVHGFAAVEPCLYEVSRALGMSRLAVVWKIALPSSLPDILGGMRLSLTVSLILAIVGEMLASRTGLGMGILVAARTFHAPDTFAGVVLLGILGYAAAQGLFALEARLLPWRVTR